MIDEIPDEYDSIDAYLMSDDWEVVRVVPDGDFYWGIISQSDSSQTGVWFSFNQLEVNGYRHSISSPMNFWKVRNVSLLGDEFARVQYDTVDFFKD